MWNNIINPAVQQHDAVYPGLQSTCVGGHSSRVFLAVSHAAEQRPPFQSRLLALTWARPHWNLLVYTLRAKLAAGDTDADCPVQCNRMCASQIFRRITQLWQLLRFNERAARALYCNRLMVYCSRRRWMRLV